MGMLQIKQLTIIHKKGLRITLKDFSSVFNKGDKAFMDTQKQKNDV